MRRYPDHVLPPVLRTDLFMTTTIAAVATDKVEQIQIKVQVFFSFPSSMFLCYKRICSLIWLCRNSSYVYDLGHRAPSSSRTAGGLAGVASTIKRFRSEKSLRNREGPVGRNEKPQLACFCL